MRSPGAPRKQQQDPCHCGDARKCAQSKQFTIGRDLQCARKMLFLRAFRKGAVSAKLRRSEDCVVVGGLRRRWRAVAATVLSRVSQERLSVAIGYLLATKVPYRVLQERPRRDRMRACDETFVVS